MTGPRPLPDGARDASWWTGFGCLACVVFCAVSWLVVVFGICKIVGVL